MHSFSYFGGHFSIRICTVKPWLQWPLKVKKQNESSSMLPFTVLAKQDQKTEQQRAKINRLNRIMETLKIKPNISMKPTKKQCNLSCAHTISCTSVAFAVLSNMCCWWGYYSPPLAYSIIRYKVFSVSITSNNWTATNKEAVTSNPTKMYTHQIQTWIG